MSKPQTNRTWHRSLFIVALALLMGALLFAFTVQTATAQDPAVATTTANVNFREGPGTNFDIISTLENNTEVTFTGRRDVSGDWVEITLADGTTGWVFADFLSDVPEMDTLEIVEFEDGMEVGEEQQQDTVTFSPAVVTTTTTVNLNMRSGPGVGNEIIDTLPFGTVVGFTGFMDATGDWVQVDAATGPLGWVAADFLVDVPFDQLEVRPADLPETEDMPETEPTEEEQVTFDPGVVTATTTANLHIRTGPGLDFEIIDTLPAGSTVGFFGFTDETGDWVLVDAGNGLTGWVFDEFLSNVPEDLEVQPSE